ncbi:MAG: RNA methyltransferase, partial [Hyphomicrobiaceae bacterium]|nr:RNA methyltransferase [Hyphomicrobiaceae bacterium]
MVDIARDTVGAVPCVGGVPVARVVRQTHEQMIDDGLSALAIPGLDRASLEPVLTYCAEMSCAADGATCPGCKRRTEAMGIASLDQFVARHGAVVTDDGITISGEGEGRVEVASLEKLAREWAGEEYWYWARRVLRKLRYG